jgi:hypothetical protein
MKKQNKNSPKAHFELNFIFFKSRVFALNPDSRSEYRLEPAAKFLSDSCPYFSVSVISEKRYGY